MPNKTLTEILGVADYSMVYGLLINSFSLRLGQAVHGIEKLKKWGQAKSFEVGQKLTGKLALEILELVQRRCKGAANLDVSEVVALCALVTGTGAYGSDPEGKAIDDQRVGELGELFTAGVKNVLDSNRQLVKPVASMPSPDGVKFN